MNQLLKLVFIKHLYERLLNYVGVGEEVGSGEVYGLGDAVTTAAPAAAEEAELTGARRRRRQATDGETTAASDADDVFELDFIKNPDDDKFTFVVRSKDGTGETVCRFGYVVYTRDDRRRSTVASCIHYITSHLRLLSFV